MALSYLSTRQRDLFHFSKVLSAFVTFLVGLFYFNFTFREKAERLMFLMHGNASVFL